MTAPFDAVAIVREEVAPISVRIALGHDRPLQPDFFNWREGHFESERDPDTELPPSAWLRLHPIEARALYEALAEHFGHAGNDVRVLRRDYDAERGRVDKLINHVIGTRS